MVRPAAITWFGRFYLGAVALKIVVVVLNWTTANPGAAQIGLIVSLLLWFGVVFRHSAISRWLVVLVAVTMGWGCYLIAMDTYDTVSTALELAAMVLSALAAGQLLTRAPGSGSPRIHEPRSASPSLRWIHRAAGSLFRRYGVAGA